MVQNDLWDRIARHRLVVFYDQRGIGNSKPHANGRAASMGHDDDQAEMRDTASQTRPSQSASLSQSMDDQVADLEAVRNRLKLDKVAVLGDSYGGMVAMAYAAAHPEHVARLILSDSPGPSWKSIEHVLPQVFPDIEEQDQRETQLPPNATPGQRDAAARAGLRNHMRMIFYSPEKRDTYVRGMGDLGFEPAVGQAVEKATADWDLTPKLPSFHIPTLIITGRFDLNVAPLTAWRLAHAIPGAKLLFFEHSGHLPSYEEPERYLQVLETFMNAK
jgi:proline iminopeptidase